ncbi:MAG: tRNA (adenosine(37)-N6)-threonylcarbamoyltransferase complex dimerization subunit type 1 TsaB [Kiritimatiellia bacterium]|nr:tRNA (adenosine(37)-N6)-threonylcarbamoyltransferase complex dimerization subunit type 1 TsaB [Kiritimatiellia bacterium]
MLILAIEQSSDTGSVAILNDNKILGEREWNGLVLRSGGLFACLKDLLTAVSLNLKDISLYVVDVGPGSYSGLRSSFAAVRVFALPGEQPIYALTSAETLAFEIREEFSAGKVQVVGDARRQQLWTCVYNGNGKIPAVRTEIHLVPENDFRPDDGAVVVSSDWTRLKARLKAVAGGNARLIEETRVPKAGCLGQLAYQKMQLNIPGEPLNPIYLHAAVSERLKAEG